MLRLNLSAADVTLEDGTAHTRVGVIVRQDLARMVRRRPRLVVDRADPVDVTTVNRRRGPWTVAFADGATWSVVKSDCGCS